MASIGDIIRIKDCQTLFGTGLCNIFYYLITAWTGNADLSDILDAFQDIYIDNATKMQTPELVHVNLRADNLSDGLGFAEKNIEEPGTYTIDEDTFPSFVAVSFTLSRATKLTRPGLKRIAGLAEIVATDGVVIPTIAILADTAAVMAVEIEIDTPGLSDGTIVPVIVGREPDGTYDLGRINPVTGAKASPQLTSQVTRKIWRS